MNEQFFTSLNGYKVKDEYAVHTYDSVAVMKGDTKLKNGMHVKTKGYYNPNDGGNAEYIITNTQINSDYQEELNNELYATLLFNDYVTPEMFGAKGDGITDDTNSIQKAIDVSNNIEFKKDSYLITSDLLLHSNLKINGKNSTITTSENNINGFYGDNLENIEISNFKFEGVKRAINIRNSNNIYIHDLNVSTTEWGILLYLTDLFRVEDIIFNQVRTSSYSNKDGVHINGGKHGIIKNIYGTTDDDMIALNADETGGTIGEISNIIIDNVNTLNNQEYGLINSTYRGIKLLSNGSLIDNITIQNCNISVDYEEAVILTGNENASIGDVYINNCVLNKKHTRNNHIIEIAVPYKKLNISNCKIINTQSTSGSFIHESNNYIRNNLIIDNVEFIDNSSNERGIISLSGGSKDSLTINNINCIMDHTFQLITIKENIKNVNINNIFTKNQRFIIAVQNDGTVNKINLSNISSVDGTSVINIKGQVTNLNLNNIITDNTNYVCNIETEQLGLIVSGSNINSYTINSLDAANTNNIRIKSGLITEFIPSVARGGDTFIYRNNGVFTPKIYSNSQWIDY